VGANDEAVEVVDEAGVAALGARDGEVGGRAAVDAPEFAHLLAMQPLQGRAVKQLQQVLKALPSALALFDEAVGSRHKGFVS
jgi:hypothetical protein